MSHQIDSLKGGSSNILGKVASKGLNMFSRVVKGERSTRLEEVIRDASRSIFPIDGFEARSPFFEDKLLESQIELDSKCIIVYCVDGGSFNEYDAVHKQALSLSTPVPAPLTSSSMARTKCSPQTNCSI